MVLVIVGIIVPFYVVVVQLGNNIAVCVILILKAPEHAATAVFIIEMLYLRGSVIPITLIIPKCSGKHRRTVYFSRFAAQPVEVLVAVVYLRVRCVTRIAYFKPSQQSRGVAISILLARRA